MAVISASAVALIATEIIICTVLPVVLLLVWNKFSGTGVKAAFVGAGMFVLFALILEAALNYFVISVDSPVSRFITGSVWLQAAYGGLAAGVFEETSRFVGFKLLARKTPLTGSKVAVTYGIGHGGIEMMLLVGLSMLSNLILVLSAQAMGIDSFLASYSAEQAQTVQGTIDAIASISFIDCFWAVFERVCALAMQISLSLMVFAAVSNKKRRFLFPMAILLHAIIDFPAVLYQTGTLTSIAAVELIIAAMTVPMVIIGVRVYKKNIALGAH